MQVKGKSPDLDSGGAMRVSSALYLFKGGEWRVFQAPSASRRASVRACRRAQHQQVAIDLDAMFAAHRRA